MKETRGTPKREETATLRILPGQKTYLLGKSPLRCYYYAKQDRARWSTADRSVQGMRWNAYLLRGKATPSFSPLEPERLPAAGKDVKDIRHERENAKGAKPASESRAGRHAKEFHGKAAGAAIHESRPPEAEEIQAGQITPISSHPRFRRLRIAPSGRGEPARLFTLAGHAEGAPAMQAANSASAVQVASAPMVAMPLASAHVAQGARLADMPEPAAETAPQHHIQPLNAIEEFPAIATATPSGGQGPMTFAKVAADMIFTEARHAAEAVSAMAGFRIELRMPENDNSRPWGFDEERAVPAAGAMPVVAGNVPHSVGRKAGVGYISSARKKVAQLKVASGAASVPQ